jgi:L-fucose mutarotase
LKILDEMGHGDQLVIADGNFPAESIGKNAHVVRLDGLGGLEVLTAILQLVPLDQYDETPIRLMEVVPGDPVKTPIWDEYKAEIRKNDNRGDAVVGLLERFAFYDAARQAYCVIATGESAQYANILLRKGVIA